MGQLARIASPSGTPAILTCLKLSDLYSVYLGIVPFAVIANAMASTSVLITCPWQFLSRDYVSKVLKECFNLFSNIGKDTLIN